MSFVRRTVVLFALFALFVVPLSSDAQELEMSRLSLNAYGANLIGGSFFLQSGFDAPLRLPGEGYRTGFALNFTVPNDIYGEKSPIVEVLWELDSEEEDCQVWISASFLYRTRDGLPRDGGAASGGFRALDASTPHSVSGDDIFMIPPAPGTAGKFRYEMNPNNEFPALQAGDGVTFGLFRVEDFEEDTCEGDVGISGVSVLYYSTP